MPSSLPRLSSPLLPHLLLLLLPAASSSPSSRLPLLSPSHSTLGPWAAESEKDVNSCGHIALRLHESSVDLHGYDERGREDKRKSERERECVCVCARARSRVKERSREKEKIERRKVRKSREREGRRGDERTGSNGFLAFPIHSKLLFHSLLLSPSSHISIDMSHLRLGVLWKHRLHIRDLCLSLRGDAVKEARGG